MRRFLLALLVLSAAVSAQAREYQVGTEDRLSISVFGHPDLTGEWTVGPDGAIPFPLLDSVDVQGLTPAQIKQRFEERLGADYLVDPHVTIDVAAYRSQPVEVIGAVKKPGIYYLTGETTLREMLAETGWLDREKSNGEVFVVRADGTTVSVTSAELERGEGNLELRAGDVLNAPEGQFVYLDGEVARPGAIMFSGGLTVSQALTKAGGPSAVARLRKAHILREGRSIPVNIKRILQGRDADFEMKPGDQLYIKESPI